MKKLLSFLLFFTSIASAQSIIKTEKVTDHSIRIIGDNFEGIIFCDNYFENSADTAETKIKRFTPSAEDVILSEDILRGQLKDKKNKGDKKFIFENLTKYRRQYIGYFDSNGEKCIYINCFPIDEEWATQKAKIGKTVLTIPRWYNGLFRVFDGGNRFWQVHINLSSKKIITMTINGVA